VDETEALTNAARHAKRYLTSVADAPVFARTDVATLRDRLGGPLPESPTDAAAVVDDLVRATQGGLVASTGPRYFGFVVGGATTAAVAADWLATAWDQNAAAYPLSPAGSVVEEVAARWLLELLGLPATASLGFTTGATMANFICLAAARSRVLADRGWDVERDGLFGAPPIDVVVGQQRHVSLELSLRYLGLGTDRVREVAVDDQGAMRAEAAAEVIAACDGPIVVCTQVGNVNSGAFDPVGQVCEAAHEQGAWVHVDGAFGLWAAAAPARRHLTLGVETADSWATDAHKWLNVPYDSGLAFVADAEAHHRAMSLLAASYLVFGEPGERDNSSWVPEMSRRGRGFPIWAAVRQLGRSGVADLVERCCVLAQRFADQLGAESDVEVLNDVVLNQVLVRFRAADGDHDAHTRRVIAAVQREGTSWFGGTTWQDEAAMRISVSNWSTTAGDVDRAVAAVLAAARDS
jgi:glutamate/tyrosine decarboxylase-like PLP-dependent enzyme